MIKEKIKKINDFGLLLNNVLLSDKPKKTEELNQLKRMILNRTKLEFSKEELLSHWFYNDKEIMYCSSKTFDEIEDFAYTFYGDSYDAVTFISSDLNTIHALHQTIDDFHIIKNEHLNLL